MDVTPDKMIKVSLVDDLARVRVGIKALLAQIADFQLVGEADNGEEAIDAACNLNPDIIIMDVGMPVMNGIDAAKFIRSQNETGKIIMLTSHDRESDIFEAFAAGADG